jgi:hypothetical protein
MNAIKPGDTENLEGRTLHCVSEDKVKGLLKFVTIKWVKLAHGRFFVAFARKRANAP